MTGQRVAACQFEPAIGGIDSNIESIEELAHTLPDTTALAVFPELCVTGYDLDIIPTHQTPVPGPITERLSHIARATGTDLVVGLPETDGGTRYNALVYVSDDGVEATYRKRKLWGDEAETFESGWEPVTVDTPVGTVGLLLCYDLNFPELSLAYASECDLLTVSAAWRQSFERDWRLLCRARAFDQTCYVVGSNHVGTQSGRQHAGESCIVGPCGDIVAKPTTERAVSATISAEALAKARRRNPVRVSRE